MVFMRITDDCYQKKKNYIKMVFLFSSNKPKIKIFDCTPLGNNFEYLRPQGTVTLSIDRKYNVSLIDIRFDGWYENSVSKHSQSIVNRESISYCLRELLYRHLVLAHRLTVDLILFFSTKKIAKNNLPVHPRDRLPSVALHNLGPDSKVDLHHGRFFITNKEFELRINAICLQLRKIQVLSKFVCNNYHRIKERHFICGDLFIFSEFLMIFLTKEFVDPK